MRALLLCCLLAAVAADLPSLDGATATFLPRVDPCPPDLRWPCDQGATRLTLLGAGFGERQGDFGVDAAAAIAMPTPAPVPDDLPDALQMPLLSPTAQGGCLLPSDAASAAFGFEVCPYNTSYLRTPGAGGQRIASLGAFASVVRTTSPACDNNPGEVPPTPPSQLLAVTGLLFQGGDVCGAGFRSAQVNFVCIFGADPWEVRYLRNTSVNAATVSADGCAWTLDVPLEAACLQEQELCTFSAPPPNASPLPIPAPAYSPAYIQAWAPGAITALVQGSAVPRALRVRRGSDGAVSAPLAPVLPDPMPASASPKPQPFPALTVLGATPSAGLSLGSTGSLPPCTPVIISLAGVLDSDLVGIDASFEVIFPRSPTQLQSWPLYGTPLGTEYNANSSSFPVLARNATVAPVNGRLDLLLECAPRLLQDFAVPHTAAFTVRSRYRTAPTNFTFVTRRLAACSGASCAWTFWGQVAPTAPAAAAAAALSPAALYGIIGGGAALVLGMAGGVAFWLLRSRGGCGGGGSSGSSGKGGGSAALPPQRTQAWAGSGDDVVLNPAAAAAAASLNQGKEEGPTSNAVKEWGK